MVEFGKSVFILVKVFVFGQKWLYSGKVVVFGQKWLYSGKVVVFGKYGYNRARWLNSENVFLFW